MKNVCDECLEDGRTCGEWNACPKRERVSDSAQSTGSVSCAELTKLLDIWDKASADPTVPNDYNHGLKKAFEICADGLRRKMKQNELVEPRG